MIVICGIPCQTLVFSPRLIVHKGQRVSVDDSIMNQVTDNFALSEMSLHEWQWLSCPPPSMT